MNFKPNTNLMFAELAIYFETNLKPKNIKR